MNPFDLAGPDFLGFYVKGAAAAALWAMGVRWYARRPHRLPPDLPVDKVSGLELAYIAGGARHARKAAKAAALEPLEAPALSERAQALGLARPPGAIAAVAAAPLAAWVLVGAAKVAIGLERHRPVGILVFLTVFVLGFAIHALVIPRATGRGERLLRELRERRAGLALTARSAPSLLTAEEQCVAFALFAGGTGASTSGYTCSSGGCSSGGGCSGGGCGGCSS